VKIIKEEAEPDPNTMGMQGGVPGGVAGGSMGGVLGGVIGGVAGSTSEADAVSHPSRWCSDGCFAHQQS